MKNYNFKYSHSFTGYKNIPYYQSKVVVLPIPYEGTVSYMSGTASGPEAIINASCNMETFDIENGIDITNTLKIHTLDPLHVTFSSPEQMIKLIKNTTTILINDKKFPAILGGEHSITTGSVRAFKEKYKDLSVLQLDAHADLRDKYQETPYSHACVMRRCREICPVVQVGIRSMSVEESNYIKKNKINDIYLAPGLPENEIISKLSRNIFLTIDLDFFDPSVMPATGTPEPGGYFWLQTIKFLKKLIQARNVVGFDIVELSPIPGISHPNFLAALLVYKLLTYLNLKK